MMPLASAPNTAEIDGRHLTRWHLINNPDLARPIFIIGTGRSGTHWLGAILRDHPEVRCTVEQAPIFAWVTRSALDPQAEKRLFPRLKLAYRLQAIWSAPRLYADKSHPNLWLAEPLAEAFPNSQFLGIERNPFATVASMLRHRDVLLWHTRWREFPIPNRFLGITEEVSATYAKMSLAAQCALRWRAHLDEMLRLSASLGPRLLTLRYEALAHNIQGELRRLESFLGLSERLQSPPIRTQSLDRWRSQLTKEEIADISSVVGFEPDDVGGERSR